MYYSYRRDYRLIMENFSGRAKFEKTSGEPATLLGNSILSMVFSNYLLRGNGPFMLLVQGDDSLKHQANIKLDTNRLHNISKYSNFKLKCDIGGTMEFCGNVIVGKNFIPGLYRKLKKIVGHKFRDYKHFAEYQISLRDFISRVELMRKNLVFAVNSTVSGLRFDEVSSIYDAIVSFAHIDRDQYYDEIKEYSYEHLVPGSKRL